MDEQNDIAVQLVAVLVKVNHAAMRTEEYLRSVP